MQQEKHQQEVPQQEVPSWFTGQVYDEGEEVRNQFSGDTFYLNAVELSIYDMIMGGQMMVDFIGGPLISAPQLSKMKWLRGYRGSANTTLRRTWYCLTDGKVEAIVGQ